uniref:Uncharacterized protein n=1 Tax=Arundo donax TaxID=35708 RepID=A0A0A9D4S6_ARUDO
MDIMSQMEVIYLPCCSSQVFLFGSCILIQKQSHCRQFNYCYLVLLDLKSENISFITIPFSKNTINFSLVSR